MRKFSILMCLIMIFLACTAASPRAQEIDKTKTQATMSEYKLPYPGMLADNPFYKLKVLRNKIWFAMTLDPVKKARLYLLFADQQIAMAQLLAQKNEANLAKEVALKGENEMTELTFLYKDTSTRPDPAFFTTLLNASIKHREVLRETQALVPDQLKGIFSTIIEFSQRNEKVLSNL